METKENFGNPNNKQEKNIMENQKQIKVAEGSWNLKQANTINMDGSDGQESACNTGDQFDSWVGKIPRRREWLPTPVFWPGESHGLRSLAGYSTKNVEGVGHNWTINTLCVYT